MYILRSIVILFYVSFSSANRFCKMIILKLLDCFSPYNLFFKSPLRFIEQQNCFKFSKTFEPFASFKCIEQKAQPLFSC